jgi:hypothetical protein
VESRRIEQDIHRRGEALRAGRRRGARGKHIALLDEVLGAVAVLVVLVGVAGRGLAAEPWQFEDVEAFESARSKGSGPEEASSQVMSVTSAPSDFAMRAE